MSFVAKDIMTGNVTTVTTDVKVKELRDLFEEKSITAVPVLDLKGKLVGIVTKSDILGHYLDRNIEIDLKHTFKKIVELIDGDEVDNLIADTDITIDNIMSSPAITANENTPIEEIALLMIVRRIHKVVVLSGNEVSGIVSPVDFLFHISGMEKSD